MREHVHVRQIPGEPKRRWFSSSDFDLIVWHDAGGAFAGFELCYGKTRQERSIVWHPDRGFIHTAIDNGELRPGRYKSTPIHVAAGAFDAKRIHDAFVKESQLLPQEIVEYVLQAIEKHPSFSRHPAP